MAMRDCEVFMALVSDAYGERQALLRHLQIRQTNTEETSADGGAWRGVGSGERVNWGS